MLAYKDLLCLGGVIAACFLTDGYFLVAMAILGICFAASSKVWITLECLVFLIMATIMDPMIIPKDGVAISLALRVGPLLMGLIVILTTTRKTSLDRIPLGTLYIYLLSATFSSCFGWCPIVSFLKILQFAVFLSIFYLGFRCLQYNDLSMVKVRSFLLATAMLICFGSFLTLYFPEIAYSTSVRIELFNEGIDAARATYERLKVLGQVTLFSGITNHSQTLGPLAASAFVFVLCDTLLVEKRMGLMRILTLMSLPVVVFMSRSRSGLLAFVIGFVMATIYLPHHARVSIIERVRLRKLGIAMIILGAVFVTFMEIRDGSMSKWLRKRNDVELDTRSLSEAMTSSRQGLINDCMRDFRKNILFGSGFQVNEETPLLYQKSNGILLSAPIEKGFLPTMILGETGVIGTAFFIIFLCTFIAACNSKGYIATLTMFMVMLSTNLGEATFFSPGGPGGIQWTFCLLGGFCLDMIVKREQFYNERSLACDRIN